MGDVRDGVRRDLLGTRDTRDRPLLGSFYVTAAHIEDQRAVIAGATRRVDVTLASLAPLKAVPDADRPVESGDELLFVCPEDREDELERLLAPAEHGN